MENRMRDHQLTEEQINALLRTELTAALATVNTDGTPYAVPVHFVWTAGRVYVHGLPSGQKLENIRREPSVCLSVWRMEGLLRDEGGRPCGTNTKYESVVLRGHAALVSDDAEKLTALRAIVEKYTPELAGTELPEAAVAETAVLVITPDAVTGKYYDQ